MVVSAEFRAIYARGRARQARKARKARAERAATPCWCGSGHPDRGGHTVAEWKAMAEPTDPARQRQWLTWRGYEETPMTFPANIDNADNVKILAGQAKGVTPAIVRIVTKYNRQAAKIGRLDLTPEKRHVLLDLARRDANEALKPVRDDWQRIKDGVAYNTDRAMKPRALDAAGEVRVSRAWGRMERILDRAKPGEQISLIEQHLHRAKESGDTALHRGS